MRYESDPLLAGRQAQLRRALAATRDRTLQLVAGLSAEDCMVQSMPDASPVKWHLAHTTWFFETFVLERAQPDFAAFDPAYRVLFNSYYAGVGERHPRPARGLLSRPDLETVHAYRLHVDNALDRLFAVPIAAPVLDLIELGIHHEQQHQELIVTDLKHHFWSNPLHPAHGPLSEIERVAHCATGWLPFSGGLVEIGRRGAGFAFDNEAPRHCVWLQPFLLAARPVSNAEYLAFIEDGGYRRPELWLSDGWDTVQREGWQAPLYWHADLRHHYTLGGDRALAPAEPVCHVSYYEADAYARWAGARLPLEAEWEHAALSGWPIHADEGNFLESGRLHPGAANEHGLSQCFGDVWEWTASAYLPYPGFRPAAGTVGEYNGKFMINQMVLRGGSCATPREHIRPSYRNFFPPAARWQFSGIRLARDTR
ncbi:ergothioneine biosynthesis protein EgtB [Chitiniphilus shinanonensis]|uniref:Ergothioneine biosynthesis protein EgtB n=1 Tax=Chitiniphilus shinanonensis TaxID=553088 RepID=A0ABQ6BW68_9NEIS|nr:ergothioneine biosynthesis protein EgtB [Chitiniphilus shinanonensis]GLS04029.1 ergothioneine biosynthesis protein EgtB [Chitiniphilus shinanonensis]